MRDLTSMKRKCNKYNKYWLSNENGWKEKSPKLMSVSNLSLGTFQSTMQNFSWLEDIELKPSRCMWSFSADLVRDG